MGIAADSSAGVRIEMPVVVVEEAELVVHVFAREEMCIRDRRNIWLKEGNELSGVGLNMALGAVSYTHLRPCSL